MLLVRISLSLANHPSLPSGPPDYILCPYSAVVDKFKLVFLHLRVRVKEYIGERRLRVRPWFLQQYTACLGRLIWMVF